ncbi:glycosyltransferase family 2 protein [Leeuwenhoekiella polynyae]|uniref:GT2 family glycosyltransferase n=1 Tax=Leeuwenhoekiella polynyae TaxID=1550906 RepID=A0A4Q0PE91_9FLAO|nr:glycosyltransferase [Leeuwenhoekiella polynyae]RXG25165.1 GT2 family glycosyltransferase [Leeuwenhoekiella polynyae]
MREYITKKGELLLYRGNPNLEMLDNLSDGPGHLWHSSLDQGFRNAFPELVYQTATFWWFINDFDSLPRCISWRVNPNEFVVRASAWNLIGGFDNEYQGDFIKGIEIGYCLLRELGGVPLYISHLFPKNENTVNVSTYDRYLFYRKHFNVVHSKYMLIRQPLLNWPNEFRNFFRVKRNNSFQNKRFLPLKTLNPIDDDLDVCVVIPTMFRQEYTKRLLEDYSCQSYLPKKVIVVDATPLEYRDESLYDLELPFNFLVIWQISEGSCMARNEALQHCDGDYVIFGDDDIRIPPDFVENHLRFLITYNADGCNGRDIRATHYTNDLSDLQSYLLENGLSEQKSGVAHQFSNANSCVRTNWINKVRGNDINFDGGYGEDSDFGLRLLKSGAVLMYNPFSVNLHLKPPAGGYRFWSNENRVQKPWELGMPVKGLKPVPSPTIMYYNMKHFTSRQLKEYKYKYFLLYFAKRSQMLKRAFSIFKKFKQYNLSQWYAMRLIQRGERYE